MSRVDEFAGERPTPLLGRDDDWATLARALDSVEDGASRVVFIEGEAGIGKTRLSEVRSPKAGGHQFMDVRKDT